MKRTIGYCAMTCLALLAASVLYSEEAPEVARTRI